MVADAHDVARADDGAVGVAGEPDAAWAKVFLGEGFDPADGVSRVATLTRAKGSLFAGVREGDEVVAGGVLARDHDRIVLQVEVANDTAARVYRRCGFELAWVYAYWPGQPAGSADRSNILHAVACGRAPFCSE